MTALTRLHRVLTLCGLVWLSWLSGCGPTGGGTGTGESVFGPSDFGARPASVCAAPIADQLICLPGGTSSGDVLAQPGTATVVYAGMAASGPYTLTLTDNRAELLSRCGTARFEGEWGLLPSGEGRSFGSYGGPDRSAPQRAQMVAQALGGGTDGLQVLVLDAEGRPLLGPLQLLRMPAMPTDPPVCP